MIPLPADDLLTDSLAAEYRDSIEYWISENRLDKALNSLQDFVLNLAPSLREPVLMARRRYAEFVDSQNKNIADPKKADEITVNILNLVTQAEQRSAIPPKFAIPTPRSVGRDYDAGSDRPLLQLIPSSDAPSNANSNSASSTSSASPPRSEVEDADNQLRRILKLYISRQPPNDITAVSCQNITKSFLGSRFSLGELTFTLEFGQITGVVGRNASGKTTLLRILQAEIVPDTGTVTYPALMRDGQSWAQLKRQIAYIPQSFGSWSGRLKTNLHFLAAAHGTVGTRNCDLVDWYIQRYGLSDYQNSTHKTLSGGFRMRYELVKALISRPRLLILDEPLASLDVLARQEFLQNLRAIAYSLDQPVPIIVTSQHLYEIDSIADQMIVLDDGKCLFTGPLEEIRGHSDRRLYEINIRLPKRVVEDRLHSIDMKLVETISDGFIVEAPENTLSSAGMKLLLKIFQDNIYGLRDITNSSRRFFIESGEK
jgi:ABC-2 type transport system ATP-binding protein